MSDDARLQELTTRLRRLARRLAATDADADDLVQDAWVAALSRPPRDAARLGNWLAVALRNLARTRARRERRRRVREAAVARAEAQEPVDRLGASRALLDAVHALDEPFRGAIVMRFLDELPPRVIAQRTGVPVETVRSRLRRALELLRGRLERDPCSAMGVLLPLLRPRAAVLLPVSGVVMSTELVVAAVVLLCVPVGVLVVRSGRDAAPPASTEASTAGTAAAPARAPVADPTAPTRSALANASARTDAAPAEVVFVGRCVAAEDGAPLADVAVTLRTVARSEPQAGLVALRGGDLREPESVTVRSGADGTFELQGRWSAAWAQVLAFEDPERVRIEAPVPPSMAQGRVGLDDVSLPAGLRVRMRVVDSEGIPQTGLQFSLFGPRGDAEPRWIGPAGPLVLSSGDGGRLPLPERVLPGEWRVVGLDRELVGARSFVVSAQDASFDLVVAAAADVDTIEGIVVDERGVPLADVAVQPWLRDGYRGALPLTDREGHFAIARWSTDRAEPHRLRLTRPGHRSIETEPIAWGTHGLRFEMAPAAAVGLLVVDAATDAPVERFGLRLLPGNDVISDERGLHGILGTDLEHPGGRAMLRLGDGHHRLYVQPASGHAISEAIDLAIEEGAPRELTVRVAPTAERTIRVVDAAEQLMAGSVVEILRPGHGDAQVLDADAPQWSAWSDAPALRLARATTDAHGCAAVRVPLAERLVLRMSGPSHAGTELEVVMADAPEPLTVVVAVGARLDVQIEPPDFAARLRSPAADETAPQHEIGVQLVQVVPGSTEHRWFPAKPVPVDEYGRFRVEHVPPGDWQVVAAGWRSTGSGGWIQTLVPIGSTGRIDEGRRHELRIDASALVPGTLRGRVLVNGEPQRNAGLRILCRSDVPELPGHGGPLAFGATTDAEGRFELHLFPCTIELAVDGIRAAETARILPGVATETTFTVARGTAALRFVTEGGEPVAGARALVVVTDMRPRLHEMPRGPRILEADASGNASLTLPVGPVRIAVLPADTDAARASIDDALAITEADIPVAGEVEIRIVVPAAAGY